MSKPQTSINNKYDRVVVLIDMDCFYCQVEEQLNTDLRGKPIAVVQYNAWRGGGIIAVNYPARAKGVTRHMRGDEAKEKCPEIELIKVPNIREKADLSKYRNAGKQVAAILQTFTQLLTRASVDEAYMDITDLVQNRLVEMNQGKFALQPNALKNTFVVGYQSIGEYVQEISEKISQPVDYDQPDLEHVPEEDKKAYKRSDIKLLIASSIVSDIRAAVKEKTGYECSAGIAHNKVLAKLVCGLNKPNKQTIIPLKHIAQLFSTLPVRKVQGLGGKFGEKICEDLSIQFIGELTKFSKEELQKRYDGKNGLWLYNISRGIDLEVVTPRLVSKSIGCCKKFPGRNAIIAITTLKHWLHELAKEITDRLEQDETENNRRPKQMVVSFIQLIDNKDVSSSRSVNLTTLEEDRLVNDALDVLKNNTEKFFKSVENTSVLNNPIKFLGLNVGKFESLETKRGNTIQDMFQRNIDSKNEEHIETKEAEKSENITITGNNTELNATLITHNNESEKNTTINKLSFFATYNKARLPNETVTIDRLEQKNESSEKGESNYENVIEEEDTFQNELLMEELPSNDQSTSEQNFRPLVPSTSTKPSYLETYAEFYRPQMEQELPKIECQQCGKKIYESEMQIHMDSHLAFQLSQQQRQEFQNQLKRTTSTAPAPSAKKMKKTTKTPESSNEKSMQRFLIKPSQLEQASNHAHNEKNIETEKCEECGHNIPIDKIFEHKDYHAAKRLHEELWQLEREARFQNNDVKNIPKGAAKNGKSNKRKLPKLKSSSAKNIASFFQSAS